MNTVFGSPDTNCCVSAASPLVFPRLISNPPGLSAIQYRIGTFTSFRRAMFQKITQPDLMAGAVTTLAADVNLTDQQITIIDVAGFPARPPFRVKIGTEYMLVTGNLDVDTWIVTRLSPAVHSKDDAVILNPANPFSTWHEGISGD